MCLISSLIEQRKQKKAAKKAQKQAKAAQANAQAAATAEKNIQQAQTAAEAQTVDVGETTDMSNARRLHGVGGTYLASRQQNVSLGE